MFYICRVLATSMSLLFQPCPNGNYAQSYVILIEWQQYMSWRHGSHFLGFCFFCWFFSWNFEWTLMKNFISLKLDTVIACVTLWRNDAHAKCIIRVLTFFSTGRQSPDHPWLLRSHREVLTSWTTTGCQAGRKEESSGTRCRCALLLFSSADLSIKLPLHAPAA